MGASNINKRQKKTCLFAFYSRIYHMKKSFWVWKRHNIRSQKCIKTINSFFTNVKRFHFVNREDPALTYTSNDS